MTSTAIDATDATRRDTTQSASPMRRLHPQDPAGPDPARDLSARASIQGVACDIVALNIFTLKALQDGWYQSPQIVNRGRYEEFQEFLTTEEQHHVDWLIELSDHGFNAFITEYIANLTLADQLRRVMDPRLGFHYLDLLVVCLVRYRAAVAHAAVASKANNLNIPAQYDYCETYQDYVENTVLRETETRHEVERILKRGSSLLDSIKIAVDAGGLSETCLSILKTKLAALQEHYSEAHSELFGSPRDLFDTTMEHWWEYDLSKSTVMQQNILAADPPSDAVTAYPVMSASVRASLNFIVPGVCLLCCIPVGYAYYYGSPERGTATDSDFWQLVAGSAMQALSIFTLLLNGGIQDHPARASRIYSGLLVIASAIAIPVSIVLYLSKLNMIKAAEVAQGN
ncbi:hypothetical protein FAVG1_09778 [Fusarium avenaceum]|nr:hypothetical protein FAVG1_09778 [Fusarium avenaceum]